MSDNRFEHIREWRKVPAKRNMPVLYRGAIFRIAAIGETGSLVLRAEHFVHPNDNDLSYDVPNGQDGMAAIRQHIRECERRIAERDAGECPEDFAFQQTEERAFVAGLKRALEHMGVKP